MGAEVADLYVTLRSITTPFSAGLVEAGGAADDFIAQLAAISAASAEASASLASVGAESAADGTEGAAGMERLAAATDAAAASMERLAVSTKGSSAATKESAASTDLLSSKALGLSGVLKGVGEFGALGIAGISVAAIKLGSDFQAEMTKINTQAQVSKTQLASLGNGVLSLAGQVGFAPDSLAEALFHVESSFASTGITGQKALLILKTAAEGAAVGHANLVDVQNALDAAVVSGIPGVENYSQAMGALNAIVGSGDMSMQDLADAMSSGVMAVVKGYGLSLNDVGSALATFGDNNIRGAVAATDLRTAVQALAVPAKDGKVQLQAWGQSATSLATDMQQHGLVYTLNQLNDLFVKNGVTATTEGAVITDMFGKKAGAGLAVLMGQLDRVNSKVPDIAAGANTFADAWTTTTHNLSQQLKDIRAGFDAVMIRVGNFLIPQVSSFITLLESRGAPIVKTISTALSGLAEGFTGNTPKPTAGAAKTTASGEQHGAVVSTVPLSPMQELGKTLRGVADDIGTFVDAGHHLADVLIKEVIPQAEKIGGTAIIGGLQLVGGILANVVAPAMNGLADFATKHKEIMTWIIDGFLIPLTVRLSLLATVKTVSAVAGLAKDIVSFPFSQGAAVLKQMSDIKGGLFGSAGKAGEDGAIVGQVQGLFPKIGAALKTGWGSLKTGGSAVGDLFSGTFAATKFQVQSLVGAFKDTGSNIASTIGGWGSSIGTAVKGVMPTKLDMSMFMQSVKDTGSQVATTVSGWSSSIGTAVSGWASSAVTAAKGVGSSIATGLSNGLSVLGSQTKAIWQGLGTAVQAAGTAAKGAVEWLVASGQAAYEAGVKAATAAIAWITEKVALLATAVADGLAAAGEWLLNAALDANPIMLIVIAIAALVAAVIYAYDHFTWFRVAVQVAFLAISTIALWLWHDVFEPAFRGIGQVAMWLWTNAIDPAFHAIATTATWLWQNVIAPAWDGITGAISKAVGFIGGIPGTIEGFFRDAGTWLSDAGSKIISGLVSGIKGAIGSVKSTLGGLTNDLTSWKGPPERDAKLLTPAGESLITGLITGITNKVPALKSQLTAITDHIGSLSPTMTANLAVAGGSTAGGSYGQLSAAPSSASGAPTIVVNVTVQGSILSENDLRDVMEKQMYRLGMRNSTTWQQYARR